MFFIRKLLIFVFAMHFAYSKANNNDSLLLEIKHYLSEKTCSKPWAKDTVVIRNMILLADKFEGSLPDSAIHWRLEAEKLIQNLVNDESLRTIDHNILLAQNYRAMGIIYGRQGSLAKSADLFHESIGVFENLIKKDKKENYSWLIRIELAKNFNNLAIIYRMEDLFDMALEYNQKSQIIFLELLDESPEKPEEIELQRLLALSYNNEGIIYRNMGDLDKASQMYQKALNFFEKLNNKPGIVRTLSNIGRIEHQNNNFDKAIDFYLQSVKLLIELNDKNGLALVYTNLAEAFFSKKKYARSKEYAIKSYNIGKEIDAVARLEASTSWIAQANYALGDTKSAYDYLKLHVEYKDSLRSNEVNQRILELEAKYQNEKKAQEIELLSKDNQIKELEISKNQQQIKVQRLVIIIVAASLLTVVILLYFLLKHLKAKRKAHELLQSQYHEINLKNEEINTQKDEIISQKDYIESQMHQITKQRDMLMSQKQLLEEYNLNVTDSIAYAKSIQQALLPDFNLLKSRFKDFFVIDLPSDIVGGDFYWIHPIDNERVIFALADCTGHGVPGAFMSILGISGLNELVIKQKDYSPDIILNHLREAIITALHQDKTGHLNREGMEMALCLWDKNSGELHYSAAQSRLWLLKKQGNNYELINYKGDKYPVGIHKKAKPFTKHIIPIDESCEAVYLLSDGFFDQLNPSTLKRYTSQRLMKKIEEIAHLQMSEQKNELEKEFNDWRGSHKQLDDVLVLGLKF